LFAKLMLLKQNVLIFDEPTNHLDLESVSALKEALRRYDGTAIIVTHDDRITRYADRTVRITDGRLDSCTASPPGAGGGVASTG
jgi:ATPase subunit of ABC transporter with duplicated ATPase domains